jgi:glycosyltransferase involved in cell wall biosynthesis
LILETARAMVDIDPGVMFVIAAGDSLWEFPVLKNLLVLRQVPYFDLPHYLAPADACLCLYKEYTWLEYGFYNSSLKLFDYMAAGKPVIASAMGQIKTVIRDGINGLLVGNDVQSIINGILELKQNPAKRRLFGDNAREDIISFYNWDRVAQQTEEVLMSVCNRR